MTRFPLIMWTRKIKSMHRLRSIYASPNMRMLVRIALLAVCAGGFWWYMAVVYVPPRTIIERDDGFHPRVLTIKAGETVTFKNERKKFFWPASDFHPSHTLYAAFDAKEPLKSGATYSFTFTEPGVYPFHDHLAAYMFGVIRVANAQGEIPDTCAQDGSFNCWMKRIYLILAEQGVDAAYDEVAKLYATEPEFPGTCHYIAHNIGLASFQLYRNDMKKLLSPQATVCAAGFYHGFMEGYLGGSGSPKEAGVMCDAIGKKLGTMSPDARLQCYHGIGHGAIETAVSTLGTANIHEMLAQAVHMCEEASDGASERYRCVSGAYNGIDNFFIGEQYGLSLQKSDVRELCRAQPDVYKEACYGELNAVAKDLAKDDMRKALAYILAIKDTAYIARSVEYVAGIYGIQYAMNRSLYEFAASCEAVDPVYRMDCYRGAIRGLYEHGVPNKEYERVYGFCDSGYFSTADREMCYREALGQLRAQYGTRLYTQACAAAPQDMQQYCK